MNKQTKQILAALTLFLTSLTGCQKETVSSPKTSDTPTEYRDNTPHIYEPVASGQEVLGNSTVTIDISNRSQGYIMVEYTGDNPKVKVRITTPTSSDPYTYDKYEGYETFPLTGGDGEYQIQIFENVSGTKYTPLYSQTFNVTLENEFLPFLYPNQYVNYKSDSKTITLGQDLAKETTTDLDVVTNVYNYLTKNITYDDDKADDVSNGQLKGYLPVVDEILDKKTGICFDYAALMATMLRTQNIPTRMQIGYALTGDSEQGVYHAWIGVYIQDIGWIDDLIQFDGQSWRMLDPTFAAESSSSKTKKFISNENNYQTKYYY